MSLTAMQCSSRILCLSIALLVLFVFFIHSWRVQAQTSLPPTIHVTEILYAPRTGGEWIEVLNSGSHAVDLTTISLTIVDGETRTSHTITSHGTTSLLATGASALITNGVDEFLTTYPSYGGPLFHASFTLPDTNLPKIILSTNGASFYEVTYIPDRRANGTGASLHVSGDRLTVAPITPGENATNPVESYQPQPERFSSVVTVDGGVATGLATFLGVGDVVTLRTLHTKLLPPLTAILSIDETDRQLVESPGSDEVQRLFTYTVQEQDGVGQLSYRITTTDDAVVHRGTITDNGVPVIVDLIPPVVTISREEDVLIISVDEQYPKSTIRYKVFDQGDCQAESYRAMISPEQTVPLLPNTPAQITLPQNNTQSICIVVADRGGNTVYATVFPGEGAADQEVDFSEPRAVAISEVSYSTSEGNTTEWLEIVNTGDGALDPTHLTIGDGDLSRTITHHSGLVTVSPGDVAIIAKKPDVFATDFPTYQGPLFRAPISLLDSGDTISLRVTETDDVLDTVTYQSSDGAKKDGNTLHFYRNSVSAGPPTPGVRAPSSPQQEDVGHLDAAPAGVTGSPTITVAHVNGKRVSATQNLFFTAEDSIRAGLLIDDDTTAYTSDNVVSTHGLTLTPVAHNEAFQVDDPVILSRPRGAAQADYTVRFSHHQNRSVRDNRIALSLSVKDAEGKRNAKRNDLIVVRNTIPPVIMSGTAEPELIFSGESADMVIVPVRVSGIQMGDWLRVSYKGSCGTGKLPFIVRNGGYGILYDLSEGVYDNCTVTVTDTAGNVSVPAILPRIIVRP